MALMKLGFYFDDHGFENLDLRSPCQGNNGIGGTQYCFLMVADALVKYSSIDVTFYHYHENQLPEGVNSVIVQEWQEMLAAAQEGKIEILVYKAEGCTRLVKAFRQTKLRCIAWAHNYLLTDELNELLSNLAIHRVVFVGKEQYDRYIDHDIIKKSTFIYNMFDSRRFTTRAQPVVPSVTYTGSLVRSKGFHVLASVWKQIVKEVPDAHLYVIGSGQLYNRNAVMGSLGLAEKRYEDLFSGFLKENGKLMPSVHFLGTMGKEKIGVYAKTTVGVMNPTGRTETFGLSAVEMAACGIPVITKAVNGLLDTVQSGKTGYLVHKADELKQRIVELLKDSDRNAEMGAEAKRFVEEAFAPEKIVQQWTAMLEDVKAGKPATYCRPTGHYTNNYKWLRVIIRTLRQCHIPLKPLVDVECIVKSLLKH